MLLVMCGQLIFTLAQQLSILKWYLNIARTTNTGQFDILEYISSISISAYHRK